MEIITTLDRVELDDRTVKLAIQEYIFNHLDRRVRTVNVHVAQGRNGGTIYAKADLEPKLDSTEILK